jgi:glycosyltransferase involved in cell wall biosynthesis
MKILLLSDSDSPHTVRWAKSLSSRGFEIGIFSIHKPNPFLYLDTPQIRLFSSNISRQIQGKRETNLFKSVYFIAFFSLSKAINAFKPDLVHAHYISSYGMLGSLTGFHPYIISVWGADIYNFPKKSFLHRLIVRFNLFKADQILSTSEAMKVETERYTKKQIGITPFGIQLNKFYPQKNTDLFGSENIIIGTVKTLEKKYGIEYLVRAFKILKDKTPNLSIKLLIVGRGSLMSKLKHLTVKFGIEEHTLFTGYIENDKIAKYHNMLDIAVYPSVEDSESFGVSVLESSACEKPVVASNVGGLPEVVVDGVTGFLVKPKNPEVLASAIEKLIMDPSLRIGMGKKGREWVIKEYEWDKCVSKMIDYYHKLSSLK